MGLLITRTGGRIFFANVSGVIDKLRPLIHQASPQPQVVVLDCDVIPDFEYTALNSLMEFKGQLRDAGILLWLAALNPEARHIIERSPMGKKLGDERMYPGLVGVVEAYL
jgi:SulP family sulfate permease